MFTNTVEIRRTCDDGSSSSGSNSTCLPPGQQRITEVFHQQEPFSRNSSKWIKLTESLCYFLAKDTQPFDIVNGAGFQKLVHDLELRYKLPDRKTVSTMYMPWIYKSKSEAIQQELCNTCKEFSFTTDMWSSRASHIMLVSLFTTSMKIISYRISGNFSGDFKLAIWRILGYAAKLKLRQYNW